MTTVLDQWSRPFGSIRISVTDRCNLRCQYCMPEADYEWLPRELLLTLGEIDRLVRIFVSLGATKVRLTGGEPLLRPDLASLVSLLREHGGIHDIALTTNALLLSRHTAALREAGLDRITISLDTLQPERMERFARSSKHADVLTGIDAAIAAGFAPLKLNSVVVRGYNDDEIVALAEFAQARGIEPRFIEYMDVGGATRWQMGDVVSGGEIMATLAARFGDAIAIGAPGSRAPAQQYQFASGLVAGVIASTTAPFCRDCDRARLTADGSLILCLYGEHGLDLRTPLRNGASDAELAGLVTDAWEARTDRGAEERGGLGDRGVLVALAGLRADPRKEMHVRGG